MRRMLLVVSFVLAATFTTSADSQQAASTITIEQLADRILKAEAALVVRLKAFKPIMEVYAQYVEPHDTLGTVPVKDEYFLGQFDWQPNFGPAIKRLTPEKGTGMSGWLSRSFGSGGMQLKPEGFAAMTVPDWRIMNAANYKLNFLRREFLGEVRCLVLDVEPKDPRNGFTGRIWVEDRDFNIVRFNGITRSIPGSTITSKKYWFNVDSWRVNVFPGIWLPSYVYSEQQDEETREAKLKSQVRIWGYDLKSIKPPQEFTTIEIGDSAVIDASDRPQQLSPTESQRLWDRQAEENVLERLSKAGLLAPSGEVDKILETVTRNLQITNSLPTEPPVKARVLLTSPLESFTIGRTIVLSRGLIDVLPDEASLALMLAHELSHITLGHRVIDSKFAFADKLMVPDDELLSTVRFRHDPTEENAADANAIELLKSSPYRDKMTDAGLFLRVINENSLKLKNLIQAHIGEHIGNEGQQRRLNELIQKSPTLDPTKVDQIAALPMGGRIVMNPWTSHVELLRGAAAPLATAREKSSLAVTPLVPYLRYAEPKTVPTPER
jgi:hypothetical protein